MIKDALIYSEEDIELKYFTNPSSQNITVETMLCRQMRERLNEVGALCHERTARERPSLARSPSLGDRVVAVDLRIYWNGARFGKRPKEVLRSLRGSAIVIRDMK